MPSQKSGTEMPIWLPMRAAWSTALPRRMAERMPSGKEMQKGDDERRHGQRDGRGHARHHQLEDALAVSEADPEVTDRGVAEIADQLLMQRQVESGCVR